MGDEQEEEGGHGHQGLGPASPFGGRAGSVEGGARMFVMLAPCRHGAIKRGGRLLWSKCLRRVPGSCRRVSYMHRALNMQWSLLFWAARAVGLFLLLCASVFSCQH